MEHNFTEADIMLIEKEISQKSYKDIAFLLDRPIEEVIGFCILYAREKGIVAYQQLLDERRPAKKVREKSEKAPREKSTAGRPSKKPEPKIISRQILQEQKVKRDRQGKPIFQTKAVDLSRMHEVRINPKTCIYIKPGQDPVAATENFLKRLQESKSNSFQKDLV